MARKMTGRCDAGGEDIGLQLQFKSTILTEHKEGIAASRDPAFDAR